MPFAYDGRITYGSAVGPNWEPVFHAAVTDDAVYLPDLGGTITKVNKTTGKLIRRINPFGATRDTNIFVTGPLSADTAGNVYYTAMKFLVVRRWIRITTADDCVDTRRGGRVVGENNAGRRFQNRHF